MDQISNLEYLGLVVISILCGAGIRMSLHYAKQRWATTYHHTMSYILLPPITMVITTLIAGNIALSLGMIGALSIVRFRTPIKDPEELAYLFLCIATGLGLGANQTIPTILSFSLILFLIFVTKKLKANQEDSKGVYLNLTLNNVNKKNSASTIKKINSILKSSKKECELRRLDIENNTVDASYLVIIANVEELNLIINVLKNQYPNINISAVDQNGIPSI